MKAHLQQVTSPISVSFVIQPDKTNIYEEFQKRIHLLHSNGISTTVEKGTIVIEKGNITKQKVDIIIGSSSSDALRQGIMKAAESNINTAYEAEQTRSPNSIFISLEPDNPNWNGTWRGSLTNYPMRPGSSAVDVLMEIGPYPTSDNTCTVWRNTYLQGGEVQAVKDYRLCRGQGADDLVIDEGDDVKLETRWIGDVLVTPFKYDNLLLISSTRLRGDILEEEIVIIDDKPAIKGVQSMHTRAIQRIELKRVKS
ncbi:unnamed protein product [Rotaria sp. Silwood1]|nr:unnamed protein product [Rotaria sp. Silwood1]CAF3591974.1 unnamed protein product [Rotaria sp. Silwood1]CAF4791008.1 unnamed protein product [Rotaria sp. Silwood1]CAF4805791.1 unnamed protein product [Rotaria sp. Silwood1]